MDRLVSIVIPVVRPEKAERCINQIRATAAGARWHIVSEEDTERIGCPRMVKRLVGRAQGDLICFLGDDTIPQPGWLAKALEAMATLPGGWGLVGLNDCIHNGKIATHWLAHRRMLELLDGEFFHIGYNHLYCDRELTERCQEMGRYAFAPEAVILHDHPMLKGGEGSDDDYRRVYAEESARHDQALFWRRKRERMGFKLGLGFPIVDEKVPVPFFRSIMGLELPANTVMFTPVFPHGPMPHDIAAARESLVHQAMEEGCTHLLMADTDQVYPADTVPRLLAHGLPVVGVRVHRRWPPFDPIFKRGELGAYTQVPDDEAFSGRVIEVDATGTGCLLFNMEVFDKLERPWFSFSQHDGKPVGEDIWLCHRLRLAGVPLHIDTSVEVGHLGVQVIGRAMYELYAKLNPREARAS